MPSQSKGGNRVPTLETLFAAVVIGACVFSVMIARISQVSGGQEVRPHRPSRIPVFKSNKNKAVKIHNRPYEAVNDVAIGQVKEVSHSQEDTRRLEGPNRKNLNVAINRSSLLWFKPLVQKPPVSLDNEHPYFNGYIMENEEFCKHQPVDILIYMHSEVGHLFARSALRETWASVNNFKDISVKTVFFLGEAGHPEDAPGVAFEQDQYQDLVQGDFPDIFKNLAVKAVMVSQWISQNCAHARYIIKADDDMFFDIFRAVELLIPRLWKTPRTIMCHYRKNNSVLIQRESNNRWHVPENLLPNQTHFPEFCSGYSMMMTGDVMPILYQGSFKATLLPIDDAFLFGLSAPVKNRLNYVDIAQNVTLSASPQLLQNKSTSEITHISCGFADTKTLRSLWKNSLSRLTKWGLKHASQQVLRQRRANLEPDTRQPKRKSR